MRAGRCPGDSSVSNNNKNTIAMKTPEDVVARYHEAWRAVRESDKEMLETAKLLEPIWHNSYPNKWEMYEDAKPILNCDFETFKIIHDFYCDYKREQYEFEHPYED